MKGVMDYKILLSVVEEKKGKESFFLNGSDLEKNPKCFSICDSTGRTGCSLPACSSNWLDGRWPAEPSHPLPMVGRLHSCEVSKLEALPTRRSLLSLCGTLAATRTVYLIPKTRK